MKNAYERSLDESNADFEISSSNFNETFFSTAGGRNKKTPGWLTAALVTLLMIIFVILAILTGLMFGHYSTMNDQLTELKHNASDSSGNKDVVELWKAVSKIMGDLSKIKEKTISQGSCSTCPPGWRWLNYNCYFLTSTPASWHRSLEECTTRNAVLLILKDRTEMNALLPTIGNGRYWIGLKRDSENNDIWLWADDSPLSFSAWNEGEPNNDKDIEHCAEILGGVQSWNDRTCDHKLGYICKGVWSC